MLHKVILGMFLVPTLALAQADGQVILRPEFAEERHRDAEISGARIMGFSRAQKVSDRSARIGVSAAIPRAWAGSVVCLRVTSVDSLYESRNAYTVNADWSGGRAELDYPTEMVTLLRSLLPQGITALLTKGECSGTELTVSGDGQAGFEATEVTIGGPSEQPPALYLNTFRADETFMWFEGTGLDDVTCEPVAAAVRTAYDTVCPLPRELVGAGAVSASVMSFDDGEMGRPLQITVHLPPAAQ